VVLLFVSLSCDRAEYFPDRPLTAAVTYILGHAGGGDFDIGNTMAACSHGLSIADGIEIDLQMNDDGTIWLAHDTYTRSCGQVEEECFHFMSDERMEELNSCIGTATSYTRLSTVLEYIRDNYPESFVSLDVKVWEPCGISDVNVTRNMNAFAQEIIDLVKEYGLENRVMVESEAGDFLWYVKTNCNFIETYLTTMGDFELGASRALGAGFSGISFKYKFDENIDKETVDLLHRKGMKIQVWTVGGRADIQEAIDLGVDFIQTDTLGEL
jgi:glycerophosphoryl diester phosphodiesterase